MIMNDNLSARVAAYTKGCAEKEKGSLSKITCPSSIHYAVHSLYQLVMDDEVIDDEIMDTRPLLSQFRQLCK